MKTELATCVAAAWLACAARAQDLTPKAAPETRRTTIVNAEIHVVSGPTIARGGVVVENGRITAVGETIVAESNPVGRVIDAAGKRLYPGLISSATTLGLTEIGMVRQSHDFDETGEFTPEAVAVAAVNPDSTLLPVTRRNGILTALVLPQGGAIAGRASVIRLDGWTNDDLSVVRDAGLAVTWPAMRAFSRFFAERSEADQQQDIRRNAALLEDAFDRSEAYLRAKEADPATPTDLRYEAMRGALRPGADGRPAPVFVAAQDYEQITAATAFALKRRLRLVIVGGQDAARCAETLRANDVAVIVGGVFRLPRRADAPYDDAYRLPFELHRAGVRWCLASGGETPHERSLPYAAGLAVAHGLPPEAGLRAITLSAAEILGVADRLGSIEVGKAATLFLADGDPLQATTRIERAFIDGREIDLSSKQTKLAEKYREKYRQKPR